MTDPFSDPQFCSDYEAWLNQREAHFAQFDAAIDDDYEAWLKDEAIRQANMLRLEDF